MRYLVSIILGLLIGYVYFLLFDLLVKSGFFGPRPYYFNPIPSIIFFPTLLFLYIKSVKLIYKNLKPKKEILSEIEIKKLDSFLKWTFIIAAILFFGKELLS